jgi:probable F420-dependent oxidoreductase
MPTLRFGLQLGPFRQIDGFRTLARRAENAGFASLLAADHPGTGESPFVVLGAAAACTTAIGLGTYVVNTGVRDPLHIAGDAATLAAMSGGRFTLGLGAGHTPAEWTMSGRSYPSAGARVERCVESVAVIRRLLDGQTVTHSGRHLRCEEAYLASPIRVPMLVGGNGLRLVSATAALADAVSITGLSQTLVDGHRHTVDWSAAAIDARVEAVLSANREAELDALVQVVVETDDRAAAAEAVATQIEGVTPAQLLDAPFALIGTVPELVEQLHAHRERWGFTSFVVREPTFDVVARVIAALDE